MLPRRLGFDNANDAYREFRVQLTEAVRSRDMAKARELINGYSSLDEQLTKPRKGVDLERVYLGFLLAKSIIISKAGGVYDYIEDLDGIIEYAFAKGYTDVIPSIQKEKNEALFN